MDKTTYCHPLYGDVIVLGELLSKEPSATKTYVIKDKDGNLHLTDSIENPDKEETITMTQYFKKELELYEEDARHHIDDILEQCENSPTNNAYAEKLKNITDAEIKLLAKKFKDNHDCNIADNDQWENIIWQFIGRY